MNSSHEITNMLLQSFLNPSYVLSLFNFLQTASKRGVVNLNLLLSLIDEMTWLTVIDINAWVIFILNFLQSSPLHWDINAVHLTLLENGVSVGSLIIQPSFNLINRFADACQFLLNH